MAVTDEKNFDEGNVYTVAVPKEKEALKQQLTFSYPQWNLVDYDSFEEAAEMITNEKADCFLMGASQAMVYDNNRDFKSVPLTKTMEACFAVRDGEGIGTTALAAHQVMLAISQICFMLEVL